MIWSIQGLWYKLRMMDISIDEPSFVFGYNQYVLPNKSSPYLTLKNIFSSIALQFTFEGVVPKHEF